MAKVPAALAVSLVICASLLFRHSGMRRRRRPGIHTPGRGYGFRARDFVAPPLRECAMWNDSYLNLRADFLISSSEKKISLAWVTISSAFHPVNGGVQP